MKFFRKKDKKRREGSSSWSMPGFGGGSSKSKSTVNNNGYRNHSGLSSGSQPSPQYSGAGAAYSQLNGHGHNRASLFRPMATRASAAALMSLPSNVLSRIFAFVCPHATDTTYETCEQSSIEDACMLCDLRDLAHCGQVCKTWRPEALKLLYRSIRIDTVHYCEREAVLSDMRKRGSFFDRNADPEDATQARLKLLCRTLREDPSRLGRLVEFLKTPYMLRESSQVDLARTIAVLPNLKYVDLPEGMFMDDPSYQTLRLEVQARCLEIRKTTYMGGSERSLQYLANGNIWTKLEVLELVKINMDPAILRQVLSSLRNLRAVKVSDTKTFTDDMFYWSDIVPPFPVLEEFVLNDVPNVTVEGLKQWLMLPDAQQALKVLSLNHTGVKAWTLYQVLALAPMLKHLSVTDSVMAALPTAAGTHHTPPLASSSLEVLHFEITSTNSVSAASTMSSYYHYLAGSLLSGGLPNLHAVYVRDPSFPDALLGLPPPMPGFAEGAFSRPASSGSNSTFSSRLSSNGPSPGFAPISSPQQNFLSPSQSPQFAAPNRQTFLQPPHQQGGHNNSNNRFSSNNPFLPMVSPPGTQQLHSRLPSNGQQQHTGIANLPAMLEVFTKSNDELKWSFVKVSRSSRNKAPSSPQRPLSSYGLGADVLGGNAVGWSAGGGARRSVFVGGAGGQFLEVPGDEGDGGGAGGVRSRRRGGSAGGGYFGVKGGGNEGEDLWPRPKTSHQEKKMDLWR